MQKVLKFSSRFIGCHIKWTALHDIAQVLSIADCTTLSRTNNTATYFTRTYQGYCGYLCKRYTEVKTKTRTLLPSPFLAEPKDHLARLLNS